MKINEVEQLAGITKKNIRFYEEQGLLSPRRNAENGYRVYGEEEVRILRQIKLLRKLGVPIEEIRQMLAGTHTVGDGMRRHLVTLEREKRNLEQSISLCGQLQRLDIPLPALDTEAVMKQMEELERSGASFQNKQVRDVRIRYAAPVAVAVVMVGLMLGMVMFLIWAYSAFPEGAPPVWFLGLLIAVCLVVSTGVVLALHQRLREIEGGEEEDAKKY